MILVCKCVFVCVSVCNSARGLKCGILYYPIVKIVEVYEDSEVDLNYE